MSLLRIKQADGSWSNIPAIKGADGIDGKDGAVQYTAGRYIQIDEDTQTINCTVKIGDLVIIDAVPVKDSTNVVSSGGVYDALETKADKTDIAGLGSEAGFITSSVEDLKNYYKKSETYSQEEVNSLIGNLTRLTLQVVQELPEVGTEHIIYLVPNNESGNNIYEEWLFVQSKWEMIGTTEVDLSNYYTKEEIDNLLSQAPESDIVIYTGVSLSFGNQSEYSAKIGTIPADKRTEITNIVNSYHIGGGKFTKPIVFDFNGIRLKPLCSSQGNASGGKTTINFQLELTASSYTDPHKYDLATIELLFCFEGSQGSFTPNYSSSLSYWGVRAYFINYLSKSNTYAYTPSSNYHPATKKYVDDKVLDAIPQKSTMPTASATYLDKVYQYIGEDTEEFIKGYFYQCISETDAEGTVTYSWSKLTFGVDGGGDESPMPIFEWVNNNSRTYRNKIGYEDSRYNIGPDEASVQKLHEIFTKVQEDNIQNFGILMKMTGGKTGSVLLLCDTGGHPSTAGANYVSFHGIHNIDTVYFTLEIITLSITFMNGPAQPFTGLSCEEVAIKFTSDKRFTNYLNTYGLSKTNTTEFIPTGDYHPATKKYVDDAVANAGGGGSGGADLTGYATEEYVDEKVDKLLPTIPTYTFEINTSYRTGYQDTTYGPEKRFEFTADDMASMETLLKSIQSDGVRRFNLILVNDVDKSTHMLYSSNYLSSGVNTLTFRGVTASPDQKGALAIITLTINLSWSGDVLTVSGLTGWNTHMSAYSNLYGLNTMKGYFLEKSNTSAFTPTGDYNPATKKYVDDAVANAGGDGPDLTPYAKLTDVLTKTNTTEYTPASAYHPATKQYVDQAVAGAGGITEESDPTVPLYVKNITQDMITKWNNASDETALTTKIESIVATMVGEDIAISYNTEDAWYNNKGVITNTTDIDDFILSTHEKIRNGEYPSIKIHLTRDDSYSTNKTTCVDLTYNGDYFYGTLYPTGSHSIMMTSYATEACMIKVDLAVNNTVIEIKPLVTLKSLVSNNNVAAYNGEHNFYTGLDDSDIMDTANTLYTDLNIAIDHQFLDFPRANGYTPPNGRELIIGLYKGRPAIRFDSYRIGASVGAFNTYDEIMSSSNYCTNVALGSDTTYNLCTIAETKLNKKYFTIWQMNRDGYIDAESGGTQLSWILGIPEWTGIGTSSGGGHGTRPLPEYLIPLIAKDTGDTLWATLYAFQDTGDTECLTFKLCLVNHLNDSRFAGKSYDLGGLCLTTPIVEIPGANATHSYVFKPVPNDDLTVRSFKVLEYYRWLETPEVE